MLVVMILSCTGAQAEIVVIGQDTSGIPGTRVSLPLEIHITEDLPTPLTIQIQLRARASVLVPEGAYRWVGRRDVLRYITVRVDAGPARRERHLVRYMCALGDSAQIGARIVAARITGSETEVERIVRIARHGTFRLAGICQQSGRARLFDPWAARSSASQPSGVWDSSGRYLGPDLDHVMKERGTIILNVFQTRDGRMIVQH